MSFSPFAETGSTWKMKCIAIFLLFIGTILILPNNPNGLNLIKILLGYWVVYQAFKFWKGE